MLLTWPLLSLHPIGCSSLPFPLPATRYRRLIINQQSVSLSGAQPYIPPPILHPFPRPPVSLEMSPQPHFWEQEMRCNCPANSPSVILYTNNTTTLAWVPGVRPFKQQTTHTHTDGARWLRGGMKPVTALGTPLRSNPKPYHLHSQYRISLASTVSLESQNLLIKCRSKPPLDDSNK